MKRIALFFTFLFMGYTISAQDLVSFRENAKYGFKDASGKVIIPAKYSSVEDFKQGFSQVGLNGKYGFIDKSGKEFVPLIYNQAGSFSEGLAPVKLDGLWGYIDKTGKIVISLKFDNATGFINGEATVWINQKRFSIDKTGKALTSEKYDGTASFSEGLSMVYIGKYPNTRYGFVDISGKEIVPVMYEGAASFSEGLAPVKRNGKWGFIDKTGKLIIPIQYDNAGNFKEGLASVNIGGKIDKDGFFNGGSYGFINTSGKTIIPLKYDKAQAFTKKGLAPVSVNGKWGLIDKTGAAVTEMNYSELAAVNLSMKDQIQKTGNKVAEEMVKSKPNQQTHTSAANKQGVLPKDLTNVFSKTFNYQREWLDTKNSSGDPDNQRMIGDVVFTVNSNEIKVFTANGSWEDTHTIIASKYSSHPKYGRGKLYKAKSKKHNTTADFLFFDNDEYGLLIVWGKTTTQYIFLQR